jgi:hypothetical protein
METEKESWWMQVERDRAGECKRRELVNVNGERELMNVGGERVGVDKTMGRLEGGGAC